MEADFYSFIQFVKDEYDCNEIRDIADNGFANTVVGQFASYDGVDEFWRDNQEWLEECIEDWSFNWLEVDIKQLITNCTIHDKFTQFHNVRMEILWRAIEFAAAYITFEEKIEEVD